MSNAFAAEFSCRRNIVFLSNFEYPYPNPVNCSCVIPLSHSGFAPHEHITKVLNAFLENTWFDDYTNILIDCLVVRVLCGLRLAEKNGLFHLVLSINVVW